nr:MAG TPA: hypothetical protein [Caudoviricetes sp.]
MYPLQIKRYTDFITYSHSMRVDFIQFKYIEITGFHFIYFMLFYD